MPETQHLFEDDLTKAAEILRAGGLVAFPTETVYGLGGDATNGRAVAGIYAAKGRPSFNPLIVHVPDLDAARAVGVFSSEAERLAQAFWPGPLTMVLPLRAATGIDPLVTAGLDSVAIRVPAHPLARKLLAEVTRPLAAPSANPSGRISPTTADHVLDGLSGKIAAVLDAGNCAVGLESTIVGLSGAPTLLRPGGVAAEKIEMALGTNLGGAGTKITAPGQLASHYAPESSIRLNVTTPDPHESYLGFGPGPATLNLSEIGDLTEAAANLFRHLHTLDAKGAPIAVAPIPQVGLGLAINDRLTRAAAPKD